MSSVGDYLPYVLDRLTELIDEAIEDINIHGTVISASPLVAKIASVTGDSVPSPSVDEYLRFLSDVKQYKMDDAVSGVIDGITLNAYEIEEARRVLGEMRIADSVAQSSPIGAVTRLKDAYNTAKVYFPHISKLRAGGISADKYMLRLFDTMMGDMLLISPTASSRWRLSKSFSKSYRATVPVGVGAAAPGPNNDSCVRVLPVVNNQNAQLSFLAGRFGTGANVTVAIVYVLFTRLPPGSYTFAPTTARYGADFFAANGVQAQLPWAEGTGVGAALVLEFIDGAGAVVDTLNLSPNASGSISLSVTTSVRINLPQVNASTYAGNADTYVRYDWDIVRGLDTGILTSVKQAVAAPVPYVSTYRGRVFQLIEIVDAWLVHNNRQSMRNMILDTYTRMSGGGSIAAISTPELFDFRWWTSVDARVTNRLALAETYEKLHQFLLSYLPYVLVSPSFARFLVKI
jgi:hypothetical protein